MASLPQPVFSAPVSAAAVQGAGDGILDKFHLAALTFQRARQLKNGARPRVDAGSHKFPRVALLEVMGGLVSWSVVEKAAPGHASG